MPTPEYDVVRVVWCPLPGRRIIVATRFRGGDDELKVVLAAGTTTAAQDELEKPDRQAQIRFNELSPDRLVDFEPSLSQELATDITLRLRREPGGRDGQA
jgi:hypothetical protein